MWFALVERMSSRLVCLLMPGNSQLSIEPTNSAFDEAPDLSILVVMVQSSIFQLAAGAEVIVEAAEASIAGKLEYVA